MTLAAVRLAALLPTSRVSSSRGMDFHVIRAALEVGLPFMLAGGKFPDNRNFAAFAEQISQPDYARRRGYRFTGDKRAKWLAKAAELEAR